MIPEGSSLDRQAAVGIQYGVMLSDAAREKRREILAVEICILAGGLSTRMQRDKARLHFGGRTLLGHVRAVAREAKLPGRVIRRDLVPRCGPLGGVCTALATTRANAVLFLACDMPFVSPRLVQRIVERSRGGARAVFAQTGGRCGFPFLIPRALMRMVDLERVGGKHSLQSLARVARAATVRAAAREVFNVNTPADLAHARALAARAEKRGKLT